MLSYDGALFFARHAIVLVVLAGTCYVLGRSLLHGVGCGSIGEEFGLCAGLGLGVAATSLFGIGLLGLLTAPVVLGALGTIHAACFPVWRETFRRAVRAQPPLLRREVRPWIPVAFACLLVAVLSCYPPTGFDATLYHLPFARAFANAHRVVTLPARRFPVFPQLSESIFSAMLLLAGDTDAQRVELLALLAGLAALAGWAGRKSGPAGGAWAASAWVGCPAVALLAATAYVDVGFALFVVLSLLAWERWRDGEGNKWAVLSGVFAGFSAGTKYHGLFIVLLLGVMTIGSSVRLRRGATAVFLLAAGAIGAGSIWYVRNFEATGNPVFPFFTRVFGPSPYALALDAVTPGGTAGNDARIGLLQAAGEWIGAPLRVARSLAAIPGSSPQAPLSPFLLFLAAFAAVDAVRRPTVARALLFAAAYAVACGGAEVRFLLPAAAVVAFAGAVALDGFKRAGVLRSVALRTAVAAALVLPGTVWTAHRVLRLGPIPVREADRRAYLRRAFPAYAAIDYLNRTRGSAYTLYSVGSENLAYYAQGNYLGDWFGPYSYARIYGSPAYDARTLDRNLESLGARYLLLNLARLPSPFREDDDFRARFRERLRGPGFVLFERIR
ncbi:MAG: ArnT family glycosyltransferase [Thermoanaerobaculia bacterium]